MTSLNVAREALYQAFVNGWAGATDVVFQNDDYTEGSTAWARFIVNNETAAQNSIGIVGNRHFERSGRIFVQIFIPINTGLAAGDTLAELAQTILEGKTISGVHIYGVSVREVGPENNWFYMLVEAPFKYFTTK